MHVKDAIEKRQSFREYLPKKVNSSMVNSLIESVRLSPSGNNAQPTKLLIINDKKEKELLKNNNVFYQNFVYDASLIVFFCSDPNVYVKKKLLDKDKRSRALRDVSIASSFFVLRATELGLGTCYIGWMDEKKVKKLFNLSNDLIIPFAITVGYSNEKLRKKIRKKKSEIIIK